jgi:PAS domain S-box-containing protein
MADNPQNFQIRFCRTFVLSAGGTALATGCMVLLGWWLHIRTMTGAVSGLVPMRPLVALCFMFIGVALLLISFSPSAARLSGQTRKLLATTCAAIVAVTSGIMLVEILLRADLGIDDLLFSAAPGTGRVAPASATAFLLMSVGLILQMWETRSQRRVGQFLALPALLIAFAVLLASAYGAVAVYSVSAYYPMSMLSAVLFVVTGIGSLMVFPRDGLMAPITDDRLGGVMARWLFPAVLVVPLLLAFLMRQGQQAGLYGNEFRFVLLSASRAVVLTIAVWIGAVVLNRLDSKRRQSEERDLRLAAIVDSSEDAIIGTGLDGIVTSWNKGAEHVYGYSEAEMLGRSMTLIAPDGRTGEAPSFLNQIRQGQGISHYETVRRRKDGSPIHVSLALSPVRDRTGKIVGCSSVARDISDQKRTASILHEQARVLDLARSQLLAALEAGRMGTWIWEVPTDFFQWDELSVKLLGCDSEHLKPGSQSAFVAMVHPEDRNRVETALEAALQGANACDVEYRIVLPDASTIWMESRGNLERDEQGRPLRMSGVLVDINARKQMEEYLLQSQKLQSLGTLSGGIAHDFNNILMAIGGNAQLAMQQLPEEHPVQRSLTTIAKASSRASFLVRQILTFSRQEESQRKVIEVGTMVKESLTLLRSTLPSRIEIRSHCNDTDLGILADAAQIQQVITNLGANAAQAIGENRGLVEVSVSAVNVEGELARTLPRLKHGPYVRITFSDNGCGMDTAVVSRIFDPFFTTRAPQRTGLGLSVVHGIMKNHDGAVAVSSAPGNGSTFHLYFPLARQAAQKVPGPMAIPAGNGERVLYVDDEEALVSLVTRALKRLGYEVLGYSDGRNALQAFQERPDQFDVVISDVSMPGMSGWELCQKMSEIRPSVPILLTSGYVRKEDHEMAARLGVLDVVLKPDTVDDLARALQRALERNRKSVPAHANGNDRTAEAPRVSSGTGH